MSAFDPAPQVPPLRVWLGIASLASVGGGPAVVVQKLSEQLAATGVEVTILTRSLSGGEPEATPLYKHVRIIRVSGVQGLGSRWQWSSAIRRAITEAHRCGAIDVFHDFGLWLPCNHVAASVSARLGVPYICSPCGMLAPWALKHKNWKKQIAWHLYQRRDLSRASVLVATASPEREHIQKLFPNLPVALVPNGVDLPPEKQKADSINPKIEIKNEFQLSTFPISDYSKGRRTLLFLGRLHPVKGLLNLVEAWAAVNRKSAAWQVVIAGPDEGGHRAELEAALRQRGIMNEFTFAGMVVGDDKWSLLNQADLFVLPSFTENFGIAIAESLAAGVPVITTRGTPWAELVSHRCGWWVDFGVEPLTLALREAMALSDEQRRAMGRRGLRLVEQHYAWPKIGQDLKTVYNWVLHGGSKPGCIP